LYRGRGAWSAAARAPKKRPHEGGDGDGDAEEEEQEGEQEEEGPADCLPVACADRAIYLVAASRHEAAPGAAAAKAAAKAVVEATTPPSLPLLARTPARVEFICSGLWRTAGLLACTGQFAGALLVCRTGAVTHHVLRSPPGLTGWGIAVRLEPWRGWPARPEKPKAEDGEVVEQEQQQPEEEEEEDAEEEESGRWLQLRVISVAARDDAPPLLHTLKLERPVMEPVAAAPLARAAARGDVEREDT
jgi:hypothetical protein